VYVVHEDRPGWRTGTELPRIGATTSIAKKVHF
jgi:hypothetical protein